MRWLRESIFVNGVTSLGIVIGPPPARSVWSLKVKLSVWSFSKETRTALSDLCGGDSPFPLLLRDGPPSGLCL